MPARPSQKTPAKTHAAPAGTSAETSAADGPGPSTDRSADPPAVGGPLRADARQNRERILAAARAAYAEHGIDVPVSAIARRAGVGVATLYRRFPTRASLVTEAFAEQLDACVSVLDGALDDPDPWRGFCSVVEKVCLMQAVDRGFTKAFLSEFPESVDYGRRRACAEEDFARLVRRAKDAGRLRADFDPTDLSLLMMANSGVVSESRQVSLAASRRLVAFLLQSFSADRTAPLPPPAPLELDQVYGGHGVLGTQGAHGTQGG